MGKAADPAELEKMEFKYGVRVKHVTLNKRGYVYTVKTNAQGKVDKVYVWWDGEEKVSRKCSLLKWLKVIDENAFPKWANRLDFSDQQKEAFMNSQHRVNKFWEGPNREADDLIRKLRLTYAQRQALENKIAVEDNWVNPVREGREAYRCVTYRCKCGRRDESVAAPGGHKPGQVWPQVGCPFAVRVEYAMPMAEGTVAKLQTRPGTDLDNYLYVMSVMGCGEHVKECLEARHLRVAEPTMRRVPTAVSRQPQPQPQPQGPAPLAPVQQSTIIRQENTNLKRRLDETQGEIRQIKRRNEQLIAYIRSLGLQPPRW